MGKSIISKIFTTIHNNHGQSLVEVLLVFALASILIPVLLTGFFATRGGKAQQSQRIAAIALMKEGEEVARNVRERGWDYIATNGIYHPVIVSNAWSLSPSPETVNGFTRSITISDAYRNSSGNIVTSGGVVDPSTKKIDVVVSWSQPYTTSVSTTLYFTRYLNPTSATQTSQAQFTSGTVTNTVVTNTGGGEVTLGAGGGGGDWCVPSFLITTVDLPKSGVANAITAINGVSSNSSIVFAGTGENASGVSFATIDLPGNPPTASTPATFDGYKTNAVFGETSYAYLATDNNSKEVVMMSLTQYSNPPTNSKYLELGSINLSGNVNATSIYVVNDKAYVTSSDNKLYIYSLTANRTSAALQNSGGLTLDGPGKKILVVGNYAYIATGSTTYPFEIVNISNSSSPSITGKLALGTGQSGIDVFVNTSNATVTRAYLATSESATQREFYIVNVSNKASPTTSGLGSYDTSGMTPTGVTVVTGNKAIVVGTGGTNQYQVINMTNETSLVSCGNLAYATGIRGIASVLQPAGYAYSYVITGDASSELKVILGGGGNYSTSGTFESNTIVASSEATFHRMQVTVNKPVQTDISMQVGIAHAVSGSCSGVSFNFVGPGTNPLVASSSGYFQFPDTSGSQTFTFQLPQDANGVGYENPGKCFRYKAYFSTADSLMSPILEDVSFVYSL